ncbi:MAG: signal peptidase II [Phototrophicales bacterium]
MRRRWLQLFLLSLIVFSLDQLSKEWIIQNLARYESIEPIPALGAYFRFTHSYNTGAAFGIFPNASDAFLLLSIVIVAGMMWFYPRVPDAGWITRIGIGLVCGGALGNIVDRIRHEHVTDFIHYIIPNVTSNISNIADHAIVLGVIFIIIDNWRLERMTKQQKEQHTTQADENSI